jgi:hypothetical protein
VRSQANPISFDSAWDETASPIADAPEPSSCRSRRTSNCLSNEDIRISVPNHVPRLLQRAYYNTDDALANLLIVGSWAKGTQVRPSNDLDMMFALPRHVFERFDGYQGNKLSALLPLAQS